MAEKQYGVAVVGAGNIANAHIDAVSRLANARLTGVASRTVDKARALAERHDTRAYDSVEQAVADPAVDVVAVCTPSGAHLDVALMAIGAGKHVVVEKPLEVTAERARRLADAAAEALQAQQDNIARLQAQLATLRTNRWQRHAWLSLKIDSAKVPGMPKPVPFRGGGFKTGGRF